MELKIRPRGKRVAIRPKPGYQGPIILPQQAMIPIHEGEVVAVGPGQRHPMSGLLIEVEDLEVGDWVRFQAYGGEEIRDSSGAVEYIIVDEGQITSVVVDDG